MKSTISRLKEEGRFSTARLYQSVLNSFTLFSGSGELFFGVLTRTRIKQYETHLRDRRRSWRIPSVPICASCVQPTIEQCTKGSSLRTRCSSD